MSILTEIKKKFVNPNFKCRFKLKFLNQNFINSNIIFRFEPLFYNLNFVDPNFDDLIDLIDFYMNICSLCISIILKKSLKIPLGEISLMSQVEK